MTSKKLVVFAATAVMAFLLTGCGSSESDQPTGVTVVGTGEVRGTPDILTATIGVEESAGDVSSAMSKINERARVLIDALKSNGVAAEDIQTAQLSITPMYANPVPGGQQSISGYQATNSVRVVIRELSNASKSLDAAIAAGGDSTRLNGVSFDIDDNTELLKQARERAFNDAKSRAEQYAHLSDKDLGDVVTISETTSGAEPQPQPYRSMEMADSLAIEPGQQTVAFQVTVKWDLD